MSQFQNLLDLINRTKDGLTEIIDDREFETVTKYYNNKGEIIYEKCDTKYLIHKYNDGSILYGGGYESPYEKVWFREDLGEMSRVKDLSFSLTRKGLGDTECYSFDIEFINKTDCVKYKAIGTCQDEERVFGNNLISLILGLRSLEAFMDELEYQAKDKVYIHEYQISTKDFNGDYKNIFKYIAE